MLGGPLWGWSRLHSLKGRWGLRVGGRGGEGGFFNWEMFWKNGGMIWEEWAAGFGLGVVFRGFWEGFFFGVIVFAMR